MRTSDEDVDEDVNRGHDNIPGLNNMIAESLVFVFMDGF